MDLNHDVIIYSIQQNTGTENQDIEWKEEANMLIIKTLNSDLKFLATKIEM